MFNIKQAYLLQGDFLARNDFALCQGICRTSIFISCVICRKSTVIRLINRFFDPSDGRILVAGHDTRDLSLDSLRQALGIVPQVIMIRLYQAKLDSFVLVVICILKDSKSESLVTEVNISP